MPVIWNRLSRRGLALLGGLAISSGRCPKKWGWSRERERASLKKKSKIGQKEKIEEKSLVPLACDGVSETLWKERDWATQYWVSFVPLEQWHQNRYCIQCALLGDQKTPLPGESPKPKMGLGKLHLLSCSAYCCPKLFTTIQSYRCTASSKKVPPFLEL